MISPLNPHRAKNLLREVRRGTQSVIEKVKPAVDRTQTAVASGVHKVMGSGEYRTKALEVNRRLAVAIVTLEDAIERRDVEIARLRARVTELEDTRRRD